MFTNFDGRPLGETSETASFRPDSPIASGTLPEYQLAMILLNRRSVKRLLIFSLALLPSISAQANEMPFVVGAGARGFNTPFVSVTICEP